MAEGARLESVYTATYRGFESPPHRHIRDESLYASTGSFLLYSPPGGMRTPDRGSTTGTASWTDREPASGLPRRGERSESIPPHRHILRRARTQVRAFFRMWHRRHPRGRHQCLSRATRPYPPGSPLCAAPPGGPPKTTKPGLARALLTV